MPTALAVGYNEFASIIGFSQNFISNPNIQIYSSTCELGNYFIEGANDLLVFFPAILAKARGLEIYNLEWAKAQFY
ncbi:hypothetical protein [Cyclobacterium roseum]|uniref:hypothetical protein n=1 Tax=Cyclobacterium roseum TaxID=2666137 RepID=UPI0013913578|nr:hypothetical protein [Cyclobacterium roseum]